MSDIDKSLPWKNQPGIEMHKIFTVVRRLLPLRPRFTDPRLDCGKISDHGQV